MKKLLCLLIISLLVFSGCTENAQDHYQQALKHIENKEIDEAIRELDEAIKADPDNAEFYLRRANCYLGAGADGAITIEPQKARADYERVLQIDPDNEEAILGLYNVSLFENAYEDAVSYLENAIAGKDVSDKLKDTLANAKEGNITDMFGRKRQEKAYLQGELVRTTYFDYGEDGRISKVRSYNGNNESTGDVDVTYDSSGNVLTWVSFFSQGDVLRVENKYDDQNRLISYAAYYMDGRLFEKTEQEYDLRGNLVKETVEQNGETQTDIYEYDDKDQLINSSAYDKNNELLYYQTYEYENGKVQKVNYFAGDGTYEGYLLHRYDENGTYLGYARYDENGTLEYEEVNGD